MGFHTPFRFPDFPGGSPGAGYLLLIGQEKVTQEKAALVSRHSRGVPVLLGKARQSAQLARYRRERDALGAN